jgi:hypothetical protein
VSSFGKRDGLYGVQIITGPRSVLLRLELLDERIEDFEVAAYTTGGLYRDLVVTHNIRSVSLVWPCQVRLVSAPMRLGR